MRKIILPALIITALLAACGDHPEHGIVVDKKHHDAYISCTGSKYTHCTSYPEKWELILKDCSSSSKCKQGSRRVSLDDYNHYPVGSTYPASR